MIYIKLNEYFDDRKKIKQCKFTLFNVLTFSQVNLAFFVNLLDRNDEINWDLEKKQIKGLLFFNVKQREKKRWFLPG